jgi:3-oxoacyl-[acyl-carrier-protein] synthase II
VNRDVVITGYGLINPQGETSDAWWSRFADPKSALDVVDSKTYNPFHIYTIGEYDLSSQVPKPGDQRAMGKMMQYGAYAAGLALDMAGVKGDEALLAETNLIAAAPGGERDWDVDEAILEKLKTANDRGAVLNEQLLNELRPTLFLAQLPNLFAGNISIIHGVSGSSRTFMGEESAGADALRIAFERIGADQGDLFLVGAAGNSERPDVLQIFHAGNVMLTEPLTEIWKRPDAGMCFGSAGVFLVVEARSHAEKRGAKPLAVLRNVQSTRTRRDPGAAAATARAQVDALSPMLRSDTAALLSGASGFGGRSGITREEHDFLKDLRDEGLSLAVRGTGQIVGHSVEAAFMQNIVLGLACLERGAVFPPLNPETALETAVPEADINQVLVTGWGHLKGEALALVEKDDG